MNLKLLLKISIVELFKGKFGKHALVVAETSLFGSFSSGRCSSVTTPTCHFVSCSCFHFVKCQKQRYTEAAGRVWSGETLFSTMFCSYRLASGFTILFSCPKSRQESKWHLHFQLLTGLAKKKLSTIPGLI